MKSLIQRTAKFLFGCFALQLLGSPLFAQPQPVVHWDFNNLNAPWQDISKDDRTQNLNFPATTHTAWQLGNYIQKEEGRGGYFKGTGGPGYSTISGIRMDVPVGETNQYFPATSNPEGFAMEMGVRINYPSENFMFFNMFDRIRVDFSNNQILVTVKYEDNTSEVLVVTMADVGVADHHYLWDGKWHHFGLLYEWCEGAYEGKLDLYIDGVLHPKFHFSPKNRLNYRNIPTFTLQPATSTSRPVEVDYDEIVFFDEAVQESYLLRDALAFRNGNPYNFNAAPCTTCVSTPPSVTWSYDQNDFAVGHNPNSPPLGISSTTGGIDGVDPIVTQFQNYPLPRVRMDKTFPRNHIFPGDMGIHADDYRGGYTSVAKVQVADLFEELYKNWNYSFSIGYTTVPLTGIPLDFQNELIARVNSNTSITSISGSSNWGAMKSYNGTEAHINRIDLSTPTEGDNYMIDDLTSAYPYLRYFHSTGTLLRSDCKAPGSIALYAPITPAATDGTFLNGLLANLESNFTNNQKINMIIENGEMVGPHLFGFADYQKLTNDNSTNANKIPFHIGTLCSNVVSAPTHSDNTKLVTDFASYRGTTVEGPEIWKKYYSDRIGNFREAYGTNVIGTNNNRSFYYYWNSGQQPLGYEGISQVSKMNNIGSASGQSYYPTPYFYPQRPAYWFSGMVNFFGLRTMIQARKEELAINSPQKFFAPTVCAGYDEGTLGKVLLRERDMLRPGQYLGLMKSIGTLGGEFFTHFSYLMPNVNVHHSSLWGWQFASPAYAQSVFTREKDLYYNSSILEGDFGTHLQDPFMGFFGGYRFWTGEENEVVMARKDNNASIYLISGTLQNRYAENKYPNSALASDSEAPKNVKAKILGTGANPLQFEIRKQGSIYVFDNSANPPKPIFYQLDKWHEGSHPERWSKDFKFEAEVFDINYGIAGNSNNSFIRETRGLDDEVITDNDFRNYTTYLSLPSGMPSWSYLSIDNPYMDYAFAPRTSTKSYRLQVRVRSKPDPAGAGFTAKIIDPSMNVLGSGSVTNLTNTCWEWVDLGVITCGNANVLHRVRILPENENLEIDQISLLENTSASLPTNNPPTFTLVSPTSTVAACTGTPQPIVFTLGGDGPMKLIWKIGSTFYSATYPVAGTYTLNVDPQGTSMFVSFQTLGNSQCKILANQVVNYTVSTPTAATITVADNPLCGSTPATLTASSGTTYAWSTGAATQAITTTIPGRYSVTVTDAGGCQSVAYAQVQQFAPRLKVSNSVVCNGSNFTIEAIPEVAGTYTYAWSPSNGSASTATYTFTGSQPQTYTCTVTNTSTSCSETASITIFPNLPDITPVGPLYNTDNQSVTLQAKPIGGTWSITGPGGFSSNSATYNPLNAMAGQYTATYSITTGCSTSASILFSVFSGCSGFTCGTTAQSRVYKQAFSLCTDCQTTQPFTGLVETCNPPYLGAGEFTLTDSYLGAADHTNNGNSSAFVALANSGTTQVISIPLTLEIGRNYLVRFWHNGVASNFTGTYQVGTNAALNFSAVNANWNLFCDNFTATTSSASLTISIPANEKVAIDDITVDRVSPSVTINGPVELMGGQASTFTTTAVSGSASYQWEEWNGTSWTTVSGSPSGTTSATMSFSSTTCTTYPCTRTFRVTVTQGSCVAVDEHSVTIYTQYPKMQDNLEQPNEPKVMVYPNPNAGQFMLKLDIPVETPVSFAIFDMMGRQLRKGDLGPISGEFTQQMDMMEHSRGIYFLKVWIGESVRTIRVVFE